MAKQFIKLASLDSVKRDKDGKRPSVIKNTYAIWVGDRSYSMINIINQHISGYNEFVKLLFYQ